MPGGHRMPFGAEVLPGGGVRFRLWAPGAGRVALGLGDDRLPMERLEGGWFERVVPAAGPGSRYRFRPDGGRWVPDPASRFNPDDVHGPSEVVDPAAHAWRDSGWRGRPWEEAVIYELHVGTFTPEGTFRAVIDRLDYLAGLGVTALELMPVADFPGRRNWGYDGVLLFAPDAVYGRPEDLKALVDAAHARGLMVLLDVVYNHFGPEGNYLHLYAPWFFSDRRPTPWGAAVNFDGEGARTVRDFFIHNALFWLEEYHFDGLRLDAVHAILDDSETHMLEELAGAVHAGPGREREIHLVLENDANQAGWLARVNGRPRWYTAQWNDDFHHACHVLLTGETDGHYADYATALALGPRRGRETPPRVNALHCLGRCLSAGFAWQGAPSPFRNGAVRGEPSAHLPATAFVAFLQSHDQAGNRAFGERLGRLVPAPALRAALTILLLAPAPPLLFMGEEFGASTPFLFFCDFGPDLCAAVRAGRRREFAAFERFADPAAGRAIPDPCAAATFAASRLDWTCLGRAGHRRWLAFYRRLLGLRRREIVPRLAGTFGQDDRVVGEAGLRVAWRLGDGSRLVLRANLSDRPCAGLGAPEGRLLAGSPPPPARPDRGELPPWGVVWTLAPGRPQS